LLVFGPFFAVSTGLQSSHPVHLILLRQVFRLFFLLVARSCNRSSLRGSLAEVTPSALFFTFPWGPWPCPLEPAPMSPSPHWCFTLIVPDFGFIRSGGPPSQSGSPLLHFSSNPVNSRLNTCFFPFFWPGVLIFYFLRSTTTQSLPFPPWVFSQP